MVSTSEPVYPTISVAELRVVLNLLAKAPTTVGDAVELNGLFTRLVTLANQSHPIGAVVPMAVPVEGSPREPSVADPSGEAPTSPEA